MILGVDAFSIIFSHRSKKNRSVSPCVLDGFLKRRIPGKNGDVPLEIYLIEGIPQNGVPIE